jgi:O-antigen/teichoic acid export membrane protein
MTDLNIQTRTDESDQISAFWRHSHRIAGILTRFFVGQGALQGVGILTGLYLVRVLSVEEYAQFGLASGFQQLVGLLMDLGFASTIIPLVGNQGQDRALVGRYVRAAKHLRDRAFWILAPISVVVFLIIMHRHHWGWTAQMFLILSALLSIYFSGKVSYYSAPLILYGRLKEFYLPQTAIGGMRLFVVVALRALGALNGVVAAFVGALNIMFNGKVLEKLCRRHIVWPEEDDPKTDHEVLHYILPAIPAMIFAAFQLQSAVFLISIFGQTAGIAQVSALGRLSQIFGILTIFNAVIVEPSMAKLEHAKVISRYLLLLALATIACAPVVAFAFAAPTTVLWLLGSKYEGLRDVVGWAMLAGALNYITALIWIMNRARKWVFWRGTLLEIGLTLLVQVFFIVFHGVQTTPDAVFFSLASGVGPLVTHLYITFFGMSRKHGLSLDTSSVV